MTKPIPRPEDYSPFTKLLGIFIAEAGDGRSRLTMEARPSLQNNYGTVHGGAIYTMVDIAMGAALYFSLKDEEVCRTVEIKIAYFKPVAAGTLVCEAKVIHRTRHLGTAEAEVTVDGGIIARALGTFYISRDRGEDIHRRQRAKEGA